MKINPILNTLIDLASLGHGETMQFSIVANPAQSNSLRINDKQKGNVREVAGRLKDLKQLIGDGYIKWGRVGYILTPKAFDLQKCNEPKESSSTQE